MMAAMAEDVVVVEEDEGAGAGDAAPGPVGAALAPRVGPSVAVLVVIGLLLLLVIALGVLWFQARGEADDADAALADARDVRLVAAQFSEAFFTFDHNDPASAGDAVLALVTDAYAEDFSESRLPGLTELFQNTELTTAGTAQEVFVTAIADGAARAVVVVDVEATGELGGRTLDDLSLVLDLRLQGGEWRVDDVNLPQPRILGPDGQPVTGTATTATTSTTALPTG
jgi:hypothetical protein